jgi:antitoxin MazE
MSSPPGGINNVDTEHTMRVTIRKWGNSASVRIPAAVMQAARVRLDQTVDIREERGRIVIEPVRVPTFDIDNLVAGITDENRHAEIDFGKPVGNEFCSALCPDTSDIVWILSDLRDFPHTRCVRSITTRKGPPVSASAGLAPNSLASASMDVFSRRTQP